MAEDLQKFLPEIFDIPCNTFKLNSIYHVKLVIGGSVEINPGLIYDGFKLLSHYNTNYEIQQELQQNLPLNLTQKLYQNVIKFFFVFNHYGPRRMMITVAETTKNDNGHHRFM